MTLNDHPADLRLNHKIVWGLVAFTVVYRIIASQVPELSNTSPTMALCFGGGLLLGRRFWWIPALLILASDFLIGLKNSGEGIGPYTLMTAIFLCATAWIASQISEKRGRSLPTLLCGALLGSVIFYIAANTFAFFAHPGYPQTLAGWWQCQTIGLPGFAPSWVFLKNSLVGDSLWCGIAGLLVFLQGKLSPAHAIAKHSG